jgi:hypothetical protein
MPTRLRKVWFASLQEYSVVSGTRIQIFIIARPFRLSLLNTGHLGVVEFFSSVEQLHDIVRLSAYYTRERCPILFHSANIWRLLSLDPASVRDSQLRRRAWCLKLQVIT